MRDIGIGLIGSGYIGKTHAIAYNAHGSVFGGKAKLACRTLAEIDETRAEEAANALGFENSTSDWRSLLADDAIDVIAIATPNALHKDMTIAAIEAGKHVYVEKPLALDTAEANQIIAALEARTDPEQPLVHMLGYNYLCNPIISTIKAMIDAGELGEIIHFRGRHNEDYMANPDVPFNWRCSKASAGTGTLGDMGSHIISMAMHLVGPIASLCGDTDIVVPKRPDETGAPRAVENEDQAQAIVRFASGTMGALETSRVALGKKQGLAFEIVGTKASLEFDQERMNEVRLYEGSGAPGRSGFKTILVDTSCPDFAAFCPAPGHGLGYNDLKIIEVDRLLKAITEGARVPVDLYAGREIERVIDTWVLSAQERRWIDVGRL
ncbi:MULTISPECIES: Gfo/Idh/MocA family protein [Kordiimonas]|uniref:Predicted dehydrogenase n=1 Tax=Kordiimonas lacus TaxID=637679 RepID=A0A1G7D6K1_9PROT|nr:MULTISPECIES: Gfo/Idh/MocA family oxidoreductase [Kordiimonas]SDE46385.1 Predicted dehydrogenase [Kordiimonas lacus]